MKKKQEIYDRLLSEERELERIKDIIFLDESYKDRPYILSNGKISETGWTFREALLSFATRIVILEWVLKK